MPVHGAAEFLDAAVDSVLAQTLHDFELLLMLDRPDPSTKELAFDFSARDKRVVVVETSEAGISSALNAGIIAASSDFIARIDADDEMVPTRLEIQLGHMESSRSVACVGSQVLIHREGRRDRTSRLPKFDWQIRAEALLSNPMAHPAIMLRRSLLEKAGLYDTRFRYAQDYELFSRLLELGRFINISQPLTRYRIHANQISTKRVQARAPFIMAALEAVHNSSCRQRESWPGEYLAIGPDQTSYALEVFRRNLQDKSILLWVRSQLSDGKLRKVGLALAALSLNLPMTSRLILSKTVTAIISLRRH